MKMYLKYVCFVISMTGFILSTTGCSWELRNPNDIPQQIKVLHLQSEQLESSLANQIQHLLKSMNIHLTKTAGQAPYTLRIYDYHFSRNNPSIVSTNIAITYAYTMTVMAEIISADGEIVVPAKLISANRDITVNTNQIFTINSTSLFQQELQREIVNLLYYWITNEETRHLLTLSQEKKHAAIH